LAVDNQQVNRLVKTKDKEKINSILDERFA